MNYFWIRLGGISGISLVIVYIFATILGSFLRPGYSNIRDSVSELTEVDAINKPVLDLMFGSHHIMLILFAFGLYKSLPNIARQWIGPSLLGLAGLLGMLVTLYFPCDVGCEANPTTNWGKGHGVLVGISAILVFLGLIALSKSLRKIENWLTFSNYTLISAILTLVLAIVSIPLLGTQYLGLAERVALVPLFLWFILAGFRLLKMANKGR